MCIPSKHCHLSLTEVYKNECTCTCTFPCFRHVEDGDFDGEKESYWWNTPGYIRTLWSLWNVAIYWKRFTQITTYGTPNFKLFVFLSHLQTNLFARFLCPGLKGLSGHLVIASSVCPSFCQSVCLSVSLSVIPSRLQRESAIFKVLIMIQ